MSTTIKSRPSIREVIAAADEISTELEKVSDPNGKGLEFFYASLDSDDQLRIISAASPQLMASTASHMLLALDVPLAVKVIEFWTKQTAMRLEAADFEAKATVPAPERVQ